MFLIALTNYLAKIIEWIINNNLQIRQKKKKKILYNKQNNNIENVKEINSKISAENINNIKHNNIKKKYR